MSHMPAPSAPRDLRSPAEVEQQGNLGQAGPSGSRITPEAVAASSVLREVSVALASLYLTGDRLEDWLDGSDHQPLPLRTLIADLIDADHVLDHRERWLSLLSGAEPREDDEAEPWLIDRTRMRPA